MTHKPQFTLKAMLGCTAALSVPLAILATGGMRGSFGWFLLGAVAGACVGYLVKGRHGILRGCIIGLYVTFWGAGLVLFSLSPFHGCHRHPCGGRDEDQEAEQATDKEQNGEVEEHDGSPVDAQGVLKTAVSASGLFPPSCGGQHDDDYYSW